MTIIAPSILSADFLEFGNELARFDDSKDIWIHLDIMDGHYVPNLTFGQTVLQGIGKVSKHEMDAHLMVTNPNDYIAPLKKIGVSNFTFHWEAVTHHHSLIMELKKNFKSVGIALNPGTPVSSIPTFILKEIDLILIMTVNPGFGGQSFISECISKIEYLHQYKKDHSLDFHIQVDGGVKAENAQSLIQAGATNLVAGSYIFSEPNKNYKKRIDSLRE